MKFLSRAAVLFALCAILLLFGVTVNDSIGTPLFLVGMAVFGDAAVRSLSLPLDIESRRANRSNWLAAGRYLSAAAIACGSLAVRWLLERHVGSLPTFLTFFPAVLLTASLFGGGPGIAATTLCALAADYWIITPVRFGGSEPNDLVSLGVFTGTCVFLCALAEQLRIARWRHAYAAAQEQASREHADELQRQNEELAQQSEELSQQGEEILQQSEELAQQNEELQTQNEEIQSLNTELQHREDMLQTLLDSARTAAEEKVVLQEICDAAMRMFDQPGLVAVVYEATGQSFNACAHAGSDFTGVPLLPRPIQGSFGEIVLRENKTAALEDAALRPDLSLLQIPGRPPFQAVLASPLRLYGRTIGMVSVYSAKKEQWTPVQFRLVEWLASQCARILETLRLQEALRVSEDRYRTLFNCMTEGFSLHEIVCDDAGQAVDYRFLDVNPAFETLTGLKRESVIGRTFREVLPDEDPLWLDKFGRVALTGEPAQFENYSPALKRHYQVFAFQPAPRQFAAVFIDVTERRMLEQAVRDERDFVSAVVDTAGALVVVLDREGRITRFNRACEEITGWSFAEIAGRAIWDVLVPPEELASVRNTWNSLRDGKFPANHENHWLARNGERPLIAWSNTAIVDATGETQHIIGTGIDITERRKAEQALRQAMEDIARSNKDLEQFAYVTSHDLKEPLRMVTGFMGLLQDHCRGRLDAKAEEYIFFASDAAMRMQRLIDDLLAYSRVGRGNGLEQTDLNSVVARVLTSLSVAIEESGAEIARAPLPSIRANPLELTQVFQNLIENAIKFRGGRAPRIHIDAARDDGQWVFSVRDNGIGVDPQFADRVFMIFQRLHSREEYPGTGIGLAICKKIVERHGGRIWIEPRPGEGSSFRFTIPDTRKP